MYKGNERRKKARFKASQISIKIQHSDQRKAFRRLDFVIAIDFNRTGLAFGSKQSFDVDDVLIIELSLAKEYLTSMVGVVRSANDGRYGIEFDFSANEYMASIDVTTKLENIEELIEKPFSHSGKTPHRQKKHRYRA